MAPVRVTDDYYARLEIQRDASMDQIRAAYRRLAFQHHPDRHGGSDAATKAFQKINAAHETLSDSLRRSEYDRLHPVSSQASASAKSHSASPEATCSASNALAEITRLEKSKRERETAWQVRKRILESSKFELHREIRRLEQEIKILVETAAAEDREKALEASWSRWLMSPFYKKRVVSEDEREEKDRGRQERRLQRDMKDRKLASLHSEMGTKEKQLSCGQTVFTQAQTNDDGNIARLRAQIAEEEFRRRELERRRKEAEERREREAADRVMREALAKKREEEMRWARILREERERRARLERQRNEHRWGHDYDDFGYDFEDDAYVSTFARHCAHERWWTKVYGRRTCPTCGESWPWLLHCPDCDKRACPKCRKALRRSQS